MDEHTLNDLLECSVCLDRLDTSSKVLPCQHTFCRKCLEVIYSSRQELRCPECRILVDIKIDELPPNVLLMRILEGMKNAAAARTLQQQIDGPQLLSAEQQQHEQIKIRPQHHKQLLHYQQQQNDTLQQQTHAPTTMQQSQLRSCVGPQAYALYDFDSGEVSDLHFKKGDLIELKRKIDENWYVGQLKGKEGTFPINYVQIMVPLPTPQCIALYDFKMGPNEEEGCLSFKKGVRINVLRRVDHNWAEGRIGATIGIFPIAFVELNTLAKQLLDSCVPASPPTGKSQPPTQPQQVQQQQQQSSSHNNATQARNLPPIPLLDPTSNAPANSSYSNTSSSTSCSSTATSHTTSPNSTTASVSTNASSPNCGSSSMPSSPQHVAISSASSSVRYRGKEKRHSLNALLAAGSGNTPTLSVLQTNRHSAEILSVPSELSGTAAAATATNAHHMRPRSSGADAALIPTDGAQLATFLREQQQPTGNTAHARVNVLKTSGQQNVPPTLPWGHLALYPYKPRKADELELKKGCVYIVTERCLDGWFKGKNWQDIAGVFPGNYVTPLRNRDQQQLMHQWKPLQATPTNCQNMPTTTAHANQQQHVLPELPPRQLVAGGSNAHAPTPTPTCVSSVWTKPLGHTVEAFFNRHKAAPAAAAAATTTADARDKDFKNKDNSSSSSSSSSSAAVNLMKRLTHMKSRSKSPNSVAQQQPQHQKHNSNLIYALENPTFEHGSGDLLHVQQGAAHLRSVHVPQMHPVHVRSGSCPSQLLQSLPIDLNNIATTTTNAQLHENMINQQHKQQLSAQSNNYGSQRNKGHKERPQLPQNARHSNNDVGNHANYNNAQQQQSTTTTALLTKCAQQQQQQQTQPHNYNHNSSIHHRKSQSLDANTLMCTGPMSTAALIAPYNIAAATTAAAIAASATTKSTQNNARESRFRCVVPYPPNSDIELELHVGDIIYVQRKQKNGWYKGTHSRTHKTGLFPASFVEPDI